MKILFLTPQLPYPQISGGVIKSFKLIEYLADLHQITLGCFLKNGEDKEKLKKLKHKLPQLTPFLEHLNIKRTAFNLLKSYFYGIPLTIFRNQSHEFKKKVTALADDHDIIFIDHYLMFQYVPENFQGRVVLHLHNAEFIMWARYAEQVKNPLKKVLLHIEAHRIKKYELTICQQVDVILAAPNDQEKLIKFGAASNKFIETFHLGDEQNLYLPNIKFEETSLSLLFIGTLTWEANIDGLLWFLKDIWPLIKKKKTKVTFTITGKLSNQLKTTILKLDPNIHLLGFVQDLEALYQCHRVFIAPLRFGSGIKVKVVNALYRGIPMVTTPIGAEGLELSNSEHLFIKEKPFDFSNSVLRLLEDKQLWEKFNIQSRQFMKQNYTWDRVFNNVRKSLEYDY
ncbi:MAG: glycosyltransferase family 4 protein [Pseudomonadota bacterium]